MGDQSEAEKFICCEDLNAAKVMRKMGRELEIDKQELRRLRRDRWANH